MLFQQAWLWDAADSKHLSRLQQQCGLGFLSHCFTLADADDIPLNLDVPLAAVYTMAGLGSRPKAAGARLPALAGLED